MKKHLLIIFLILLAAFSRLIPHLPNFTAITALALFSGFYLDKKYAFIIPLISLLISDYVIGFYNGMIWTYGAFALISIIGIWLHNNQSIRNTIVSTFIGSTIFYIITNFGVWISNTGMYSLTFDGLIKCYTMAIPFFRNSILGDFTFVSVLFGSYSLMYNIFKLKNEDLILSLDN